MNWIYELKRLKTTVFLSCEANDDLELVKVRLAEAINENTSNIQLRKDKSSLLDEEKTLNEQDLHDDDIVYYVLKLPDSNDWEEVDVKNNDDQQQELNDKK